MYLNVFVRRTACESYVYETAGCTPEMSFSASAEVVFFISLNVGQAT